MVEQTKTAAERAFDRLSDILRDGVDVHRCAAASALGKSGHPGAGPILATALLDEDEDVRIDVVTALSVICDKSTGAAVMENFLGDPSPEVKLSAITMLADINYRQIVPHLLKLVTAQDEELNWDENTYYDTGWEDWLDIQLAAIKALGKMRVSVAVPEILKAMDDPEGQDVTETAIPLLARLGDAGAVALEKLSSTGDARMRRRICASLILGASARMDKLLDKALHDKSSEVRRVAVAKLLAHNAGDSRLTEFFRDRDSAVRKLLIERLGAKHPEQVSTHLSDKSAEVRQAAFRVIAARPELFEKAGFSEIVRIAIAGNPNVAGDASVAWASLIGTPSASSLGGALRKPGQPLAFRIGLIEALALLGDAGLAELSKAAGDETRQVRISALTAIAEVAKKTPWPNTASQILMAALNGDLVESPQEREEQHVLEGACDDSATPRADQQRGQLAGDNCVTDTSGQSNEQRAEEPAPNAQAHDAPAPEGFEATSTLEQMLKDGIRTEAPSDGTEEPEPVDLNEEDEHFVEIAKLRAMKKRKVSLDVKVAPHQDVRRFAAQLLGDFDEPGLASSLKQALAVEDDELQLSCLESLARIAAARGRLSVEIGEQLRVASRHKDRAIRLLAARCLGFVDAEASTSRLIEMAEDHDVHVRLDAIRALGRNSANAGRMVQALQDDYSGVRMAAAKALARQRLEMDKLIELTLGHNGMHRGDMVALFIEWNPNEASEKYLKILGDESRKRVWLIAIQALGSLIAQVTPDVIVQVA